MLTTFGRELIAEAKAELCAPRVWFNNAQAADYLSIGPGTLSQMRSRGEGPKWTGSGKLTRYKRTDIDLYLANLPRAGGDDE
jgi:hypothetical protein